MVNVGDVSQPSPSGRSDSVGCDRIYQAAVVLRLVVMLAIVSGRSVNKELTAADFPHNILLITCHNLGYGDSPCYNSESSIVAPNLSRLASEGVRLTNF